jgi:hypothetical protein
MTRFLVMNAQKIPCPLLRPHIYEGFDELEHAKEGIVGIPTKVLRNWLNETNVDTSVIHVDVLQRLHDEGQEPSSVVEIVHDVANAHDHD